VRGGGDGGDAAFCRDGLRYLRLRGTHSHHACTPSHLRIFTSTSVLYNALFTHLFHTFLHSASFFPSSPAFHKAYSTREGWLFRNALDMIYTHIDSTTSLLPSNLAVGDGEKDGLGVF
jgi:hypothetical protein